MEESAQTIKRKLQEATGYPAPNFNKLVEGHVDYDSEFSYTLNYANYMFEAHEMKKHTEEWLDRKFPNTPDYKFVGIGAIAWLLNHSGYVKPDVIQRASEKINKISMEEAKLEQEKIIELKEPSMTPMQIRTMDVIADLEVYIDNMLLNRQIEKSPEEIFKDGGTLDKAVVQQFIQDWKSATKDDASPPDPEMKNTIDSHVKAIEDAFNAIPSTERAARKTKLVDPSKLVKKLKYNDQAIMLDDLLVTSVLPEKIIGAQVLWVYNVKTRKLGQYVAYDENGLSVKGSTIMNYDSAKSFQKIARKPKILLTTLLVSGKVTQNKLLGSIKAVESVLSGRINNDTILVKTFQ